MIARWRGLGALVVAALSSLVACAGTAATASSDPGSSDRVRSAARDPLAPPPIDSAAGAHGAELSLVGVTADDWAIVREARAEGGVVHALALDGTSAVEIDARSDVAVIRNRVVFSLAGARLTAWSPSSGAHVVSTAAAGLDVAVAANAEGSKIVWGELHHGSAETVAMMVASVDGTQPTVAIAAIDPACRPRSVTRGARVLLDVCDPSRSVSTLQVIDTTDGLATPLVDSVSSWSVDDAGVSVAAIVKAPSGRLEAMVLPTSGDGPILDVGQTDGPLATILGDGSAVVFTDRRVVRVWLRATRTATTTGAAGMLGPIAPDGGRFVYSDLYGRGVATIDGRSPPLPLPLVTGDTLNADAFTADGGAVVYLADPDPLSPLVGTPAVASVTTGARRLLGPAGTRVDRVVPTRGAQLVFLARSPGAPAGDLCVVDATSGGSRRLTERASDFAVDAERARVVWLEPRDGGPRVHVATL